MSLSKVTALTLLGNRSRRRCISVQVMHQTALGGQSIDYKVRSPRSGFLRASWLDGILDVTGVSWILWYSVGMNGVVAKLVKPFSLFVR